MPCLATEPRLKSLQDRGFEETQWNLVHARYQGWMLARFLSPDLAVKRGPIENPQGWNRYTYGGNNPVTMVDPDGRAERKPSLHQRLANFISDVFFGVGEMMAPSPWPSSGVPVNQLALADASSPAGEHPSEIGRKVIKTGGDVVGELGAVASETAAMSLLSSVFTRSFLSKSRVIARGRAFRGAKRLAKKYGGSVRKWTKKSSGVLETADGRQYEIHWVEHPGIGRKEAKVKWLSD